jgi:uncharacterized protein (TIGR02444 family)
LSLWAFALAAWDRPGVSEACLQLQDQHGQCVCLLLWRTWAHLEGRMVSTVALAQAINLAGAQEQEVIAPLRAARRSIKASEPPSRLEAAREAEIAAERALLSALEALSPPDPSQTRERRDLPNLLEELAQAWNGCRARSTLKALATLLG